MEKTFRQKIPQQYLQTGKAICFSSHVSTLQFLLNKIYGLLTFYFYDGDGSGGGDGNR